MINTAAPSLCFSVQRIEQ